MKKNILQLILLSIVLFSCNSKYPLDLGQGYKIEAGDEGDLYIGNIKDYIIIDTYIVGYNFDSTFIIVEQKPIDIILKGIENNPEMTSDEANKIFEESPIRQYWILNKKEKCIFDVKTTTHSNVYGPFDKKAFLNKKKELGISNLELLLDI